jgi:hypothetical protein
VAALIFTLGCAFGCKRSELDALHGKWKKLQLSPLAGSYYLQQAMTSQCAWNVQSNEDGLTIKRIPIKDLQRPREFRAEFAGGALVGENRGEWGGKHPCWKVATERHGRFSTRTCFNWSQ